MPLDSLLRGNDDSWGYVIIHTIVIAAQAEIQCALALSVLDNEEIRCELPLKALACHRISSFEGMTIAGVR